MLPLAGLGAIVFAAWKLEQTSVKRELRLVLRHPLTKVPENTLKFTVACALLAFGTFWSLGGLLDEAKVWPLGDATLLLLFAAYVVAGRLSAFKLRVPQLTTQGARA